MNKITQTIYLTNKTTDSVEKKVKNIFEQLGGIRQWVSPGVRILIKLNWQKIAGQSTGGNGVK